MHRIVMLGIDSGDLEFIKVHMDRLPVIGRMMQDGILRRLETTSRVFTGSVWPTFYTGFHPGEHGIYHHLQWDPLEMRTRRVSADWLSCEPFWYELARNGVRVTIADVPMTFPSQLENGTEVVNWGSHDQLGPFHCNRLEWERTIRGRFGKHPMGAEIPVRKTKSELEGIRKKLIAGAELKGRLLQYLLSNTKWDFFLAVFGECHRGGHILWPEPPSASMIGKDALLDVYKAVDRALGTVLDAIDPSITEVILFSLHGMEDNLSQEHFVAPVMQRINILFAEEWGQNRGKHSYQRSFMRVLRNRLPARVQNVIARVVPVGVRDWVVSRTVSAGYKWKRTPGFAQLADFNGYLRLNLRGRESAGCLTPGEASYRKYLQWLEKAFRGLRTADGQAPIVRELVWTAEAFPGRRSGYLPDLVVTWDDHPPQTSLESEQLGRIIARLETGRSGNHRHEGFMVFKGPDKVPGDWASVDHIKDIAPVLLREYLGRRNAAAPQ
jgi:predicted AlkP superfamily phosphohydrolase/phosphomutase